MDSLYAPFLSYESYPLQVGNVVLSDIRNVPILKNRRLLLTEQLYNCSFLMSQAFDGEYKLTDSLAIDAGVRDTFVIVGDNYADIKDELRYMSLDGTFMFDGTVCLSYSIPDVSIQPLDSVRSCLAFYNTAAFLEQTADKKGWILHGRPIDKVHSLEYMDQHFVIYPFTSRRILLGCQAMDWPLNDPMPGDTLHDIMTDAYYRQPRPYVAVYDLDSARVVQRFGQLDEVCRQTHTGYWFSNLVAASYGGQLVYGGAHSGHLQLVDIARPERTLRVYTLFGYGDLLVTDSALCYQDEYMQQFVQFFDKSIYQVTLDRKYVNCILRTGIPGCSDYVHDRFEFVRLSRRTGRVQERFQLFPQTSDERVLAYGIRADAKDNTPFYLSKLDGKYYLKTIRKK